MSFGLVLPTIDNMSAQSVIGIDLGSSSIKAVELIKKGTEISLSSLGSIPTPPRGLLSDLPLDEQAVVDVLVKLLTEMKVTSKDVNASIAESGVFTKVIELPNLTEKELSSSIQWEAEQYIPLPIDQVNIDYAILSRNQNGETMQVLLIAASKKLIDKYTRIFEAAKLSLLSLETDAISLSRIIPKALPPGSSELFLNIGASNTIIGIVRSRTLVFVRTIPSGGDNFTKAISEELGFNGAQAEEYKRTYGLDRNQLEGKIYASLQPVVGPIGDEVAKVLAYFADTYQNEKINTILLSGGSVRMPGIVSFFAQTTGIDTQIVNPFESIGFNPSQKSIIESNSPFFSISVGLALKNWVS